MHDRVSLITAIFLDDSQVERVRQISGDDAQNLIDIIDRVSPRTISSPKNKLVDFDSNFHILSIRCWIASPEVRGRCLCYLYAVYDQQALLPRSLQVPLCYDTKGYPLGHGGSADVWKGRHLGQEVAAKVLRVYSKNDLKPIERVGRWLCP